MSRIKEAFAKGKAFIPFLTCGDPDLETTKKLVRAMADSGADLIELGIPFSDPTAEGPVIQGANLRALSGGVTTDKIFAMVEELRKDVSVPLVFHDLCQRGVLLWKRAVYLCLCPYWHGRSVLPDVPFEEKAEFDGSAAARLGAGVLGGAHFFGSGLPVSPGRRPDSFMSCPRWGLPASGRRSPPISAQWYRRSRRIRICPVQWGSVSPHRNRPKRWRPVPTASLSAVPLCGSSAQYGQEAVPPVAEYDAKH